MGLRDRANHAIERQVGKAILDDLGYDDTMLLERAVRSVARRGKRTAPPWAAIADTFACGSTAASALCVRFGIDPDEHAPRGGGE